MKFHFEPAKCTILHELTLPNVEFGKERERKWLNGYYCVTYLVELMISRKWPNDMTNAAKNNEIGLNFKLQRTKDF